MTKNGSRLGAELLQRAFRLAIVGIDRERALEAADGGGSVPGGELRFGGLAEGEGRCRRELRVEHIETERIGRLAARAERGADVREGDLAKVVGCAAIVARAQRPVHR